jgi:hypothetical protein
VIARTYFSPLDGSELLHERHEVGLLSLTLYDHCVRNVATRKGFGLHLEINFGIDISGVK